MPDAEKTFIDSSVLIYAFDESSQAKYQTANNMLSQLWMDHSGSLSVQVLEEFYTNITRKVRSPIARSTATKIIDDYAQWCGTTTVHEVQAACRIEREAKVSFWDALIVACAQKNGATRILSEDLNHGQVIDGVEIVNPFRNI
jgi:predicted nucleic acid-binding protein